MVEEGHDLYIVIKGLALLTWHLLWNVLPWPTWISIFLHLASKQQSFIKLIRTHPQAVKLSYVVYYILITTHVYVETCHEMMTSFWEIIHSAQQRLWTEDWTFELDYEMVLSRLVYHAVLWISWAFLKKFKATLSKIIVSSGKVTKKVEDLLNLAERDFAEILLN